MKRRRRKLRSRRRFGHYGTLRGAEHRSERDELAAMNIPAHLVPLWNRRKGQFRGTPHERYEQFMHSLHEGSEGEEMIALQEDADARLEAMVRERESRPQAPPCSVQCMASTGQVCKCHLCRGQNHGLAAA